MSTGWTVLLNIAAIGVFYGLGFAIRRWIDRRPARDDTSSFSPPGFYVEVDCRACGQFNRVPSHRLRDRPKCGRCKARLMPGKRLCLCRVTTLDRTLQIDLDAAWKDEDRLWQCLADHVLIQSRAQDARTRMVN